MIIRQFSFEDLIRSVSVEADIFVPIISYKEIPQESWRCLPLLINSGTARPPDLVVCAHLDLVGTVLNDFEPFIHSLY